MSDEDNNSDGMSEDEKLAAEWENAMEESGDAEGGDAGAEGQAPPQAYTQLVQGTHVGVVVGGEEFDPARASHVAVRAPSPFLGLGLYVASD